MAIVEFPPVDGADEYGLLAVGGDVEVSSLLLAYRSGIFPWPLTPSGLLAWFAPPERAILRLEKFHIPRSLKKKSRNNLFRFAIDTAFDEVIAGCAEGRERKKKGTWMTADIIRGYSGLHKAGYAHSVECFHGPTLAGGLYGVSLGKMFAAESMFFTEDDASKLCLCYLVQFLAIRGVTWVDCQQLTPLLERFGVVEIPRSEYMSLLQNALAGDSVAWK